MNRIGEVLLLLSLFVLSACTKDIRQAEGRSPTIKQDARLVECDGPRGTRSNCDEDRQEIPVEEMMRTSVAMARTVRVARSVVAAQVDRVMAIEKSDERLQQMKLLARIVADRPVDMSNPSNRAFSQEIRFVMGLEVFDGFVKLGDIDEAWTGLLGMLSRYRDATDEARKEFENGAGPQVGQNGADEKRDRESASAREYYRTVQNGYAAAKEFTRLFVIPNVGKKYPLSKDVMERLMDATR